MDASNDTGDWPAEMKATAFSPVGERLFRALGLPVETDLRRAWLNDGGEAPEWVKAITFAVPAINGDRLINADKGQRVLARNDCVFRRSDGEITVIKAQPLIELAMSVLMLTDKVSSHFRDVGIER